MRSLSFATMARGSPPSFGSPAVATLRLAGATIAGEGFLPSAMSEPP
jgi:hypothetical protein